MSDPHELSVTRLIKASPEAVWRIYTERTRDWFCPRPWTTPEVHFDLRPGGRADVTMQSPEGERHSYRGVFLEVLPNRKLVSTSALSRRATVRVTPPAPFTGTPRPPRLIATWASNRAGVPSPASWPNWRRPRNERQDHPLPLV